jgi:alpha-mannosidase
VASGGVADFLQRLQTRVGQDCRLPIWVGELYLEYHRGTYTSQARVKQANRFAERDLHNAEWLASMAQVLLGRDYPLATLDQVWKPFLTNQFHDILPGSAIGPVYVDALETYARIREITERIIEQGKQALVEASEAQEGALVVFNSTGWQRSGLVHVASDLPVPPALSRQRLADGSILVEVQDVPALGYALFAGGEQEQSESSSLYAAPDLLESCFYRIELDAHGHIVQLWDKQAESGAGRAVIPVGQHANVFQLFEDKPINFDAWDIDTFYEEKMWELDDPEITVVEAGPLRAGVQLVWSYQQRTRIVQQIYLYEHSRRIDFVTSVDWQERQTLLKVAFPVAVHATYATAEIQFGTIARPTHRNTSWDQARFETVGHRWIDLSEAGYGVAILNDCKYGYDVHANVMRLTLLKGAIAPDPLADVGGHTFTYSLLPHDGDWSRGQVQRQAYELNYPLLYALKTSVGGTQMSSLSLVSCDQEHVVIETVKHAESEPALIFRIYECANRRGPFKLHWSFPALSVWETNLLEDVKKEVRVLDDRKTLIGSILPYEVKTFLVYYEVF